MRALLVALLIGCVPEPQAPRPSFAVTTRVAFTNKMSSGFLLRRLTIAIDGAQIAARGGDNLANDRELSFGALRLSAGEHEVSVQAEFQGNGYGVFSYLKGYRFKASTRFPFEITEPLDREVRCTAYDEGGPTTPIEERPQIRCQMATLHK